MKKIAGDIKQNRWCASNHLLMDIYITKIKCEVAADDHLKVKAGLQH